MSTYCRQVLCGKVLKLFDRIDKLLVVSKSLKHETAEKVAEIMQQRLNIRSQVCYTEPDYVYNIKTGQRLMDGIAVTAMCAIGQPEHVL